MTYTTTCKWCRDPITAIDADDFVAQVQAHARDHGGAHGTHVPSREHILAHADKHRTEAYSLIDVRAPTEPSIITASASSPGRTCEPARCKRITGIHA